MSNEIKKCPSLSGRNLLSPYSNLVFFSKWMPYLIILQHHTKASKVTAVESCRKMTNPLSLDGVMWLVIMALMPALLNQRKKTTVAPIILCHKLNETSGWLNKRHAHACILRSQICYFCLQVTECVCMSVYMYEHGNNSCSWLQHKDATSYAN